LKRSTLLDRYKRFVGEDLLERIYQAAESLTGLRILHLNTTAQGGGVAELLHTLIPVMDELGIINNWQVIPLDDASNRFTAHLVDLLQGIEHGNIAKRDQQAFLDRLYRIALKSGVEHNQADIYFIHDFQLAPLATFFPRLRPAIWMCHVDTANPDPGGKTYIEQFLTAYNVCVFNTPFSIFKDLPAEKAHVITPTIDPFSEKK
jgi:trehalose synthase